MASPRLSGWRGNSLDPLIRNGECDLESDRPITRPVPLLPVAPQICVVVLSSLPPLSIDGHLQELANGFEQLDLLGPQWTARRDFQIASHGDALPGLALRLLDAQLGGIQRDVVLEPRAQTLERQHCARLIG